MVEVGSNHIYRKYGENDKYSVGDFGLHIKDKGFTVLAGPSGYGKSTTLRMATGLGDISKNTLGTNYKAMSDVAPKDRSTVMAFQDYALHPHMSIYGNMALGSELHHYKKSKTDKRVKHATKTLGLSKYLDKRPSELSGGQRQHVALGRAIIRDVPTFLTDEPLSNLDARLRVTMRVEIAKLHQNLGTTTIYITHDQIEAMALADRVVAMSVGQVQQIRTPPKVYNKPVSMFVAGFIGSPQMDFFSVHFEGNRINDGKDLNIEIPGSGAKMLEDKGYESKDLIFGVRPKGIHSGETFFEIWPDQVVKSIVVVSELLGSTIQLYQKVDGTELVAIVNTCDYRTLGDEVEMGFDVDKAHFSDKDTTGAIC